MSNRKYASGYEKLKKKRRIESLIQFKKIALEKFLTSSKRDEVNSSEEIIKQKDLNELGDDEVLVEKTIENKKDDEMVSEEGQGKNEEVEIDIENKDVNDNLSDVSINIYDPGRWKYIDNKLSDLLVEKGPIRESDINC